MIDLETYREIKSDVKWLANKTWRLIRWPIGAIIALVLVLFFTLP